MYCPAPVQLMPAAAVTQPITPSLAHYADSHWASREVREAPNSGLLERSKTCLRVTISGKTDAQRPRQAWKVLDIY